MNVAPIFGHISLDEPPPIDQLENSTLQHVFLPSDMAYGSIQHFPSHSPQEAFDHRISFSSQHMDPTTSTQPEEHHVCGICGKPFERPCDLNKHAKTHIRPFKCPFPDCKYYHVGWPTEKELDRHRNDKHLEHPLTFACEYAGCGYTAKRESNCKQHMEKTHGWEYVRSRQMKAYKCPIPDCVTCSGPEESQQVHASTPVLALPLAHQHHDFTLFPDGGNAAMFSAHPGLGYLQHQQQGAGAATPMVPWHSPASRERQTGQVLRGFDASFQPHSVMAGASIPVDPQLMQTPAGPGGSPSKPRNLSPGQLFPDEMKQTRSPATLSPLDNESRWTSSPNYTTSGTRSSSLNVPKASSTTLTTPSAIPRTVQRLKREERDLDDDDDDDESDVHPGKRAKYLRDDDFEDNEMPCPFRLHDAAFFDRNSKEKFSPCHTKHKDISTIVRHLGRPAHMLSVQDLAISSFDMAEDDHLYPQAGLCRRCWRAFRDQAKFEDHLSRPCIKKSKGKREKFWLLYETFCAPPAGAVDGPERPASAGPTASHVPGSHASADAQLTPTHSAQEPTDPGTAVCMSDHLALVERVKELEEGNRRLWSAISMLPQQQQQQQVAVSLRQAPVVHLARVPEPNLRRRPADRENLVGGMNSRSTDVDREGLILEVQRTMSGLSSSTDRSSVLHAPLSPRFDEYRRQVRMAAEQERRERSPGYGSCADEGQASKHAPSITDSAYYTEKDRSRALAGDVHELPRIPEQDERAARGGGEASGEALRRQQNETFPELSNVFAGLEDASWS